MKKKRFIPLQQVAIPIPARKVARCSKYAWSKIASAGVLGPGSASSQFRGIA